MPSLPRYMIVFAAFIGASCVGVPKTTPTAPGGAIFDVTVRTLDGRTLDGQSVYRPSVPDVFCVRNTQIACKGVVHDSVVSDREISFVFDCDEGTDGIAIIRRDRRGNTLVPLDGVVRKRDRVWAEIDIALNRRVGAEDDLPEIEELKACERKISDFDV